MKHKKFARESEVGHGATGALVRDKVRTEEQSECFAAVVSEDKLREASVPEIFIRMWHRIQLTFTLSAEVEE